MVDMKKAPVGTGAFLCHNYSFEIYKCRGDWI